MKSGTKALKLNICFKLPEDFDGDMNDAIEELLKYRRTKDKNYSGVFNPTPERGVWSNWWDMVHETDRLLYGEVSMSEYDEDSNEFKSLKI